MSTEQLTIGIIGGTGKMGSFFHTFFQQKGLNVLISGRTTKLTQEELCQKSDIVIISVPLDIAPQKIKEVISQVKTDTLLVDFSSLQQTTNNALKKFNGPSVSIHPLFGPLVKSIENQAFSFTENGSSNKKIEFLKDLFSKNGAKIITLLAEEHDKQMAQIQALVHLSNIALAKTLTDTGSNIHKDLSTPLFRLQSLVIGRILGQSSELYENILMENPEFIPILKTYLKNIQLMENFIEKKDKHKFEKVYTTIQKKLGSFIQVAEQKTSEVLSLIDKQPIKHNLKEVETNLKNASVAYLGPEGTYSYQAAKAMFPKTEKLIPVKTITDVFDAVNSGETDYGVVPSENLIEGVVKDTLNNMIDYPIHILAEFALPIHHALISYGSDPLEIKIIKSHPQALGQCKNWLKSNFPNTPIESASSTLAAIAEENPEVGIIAGKLAAEKYGLNILRENIGDNPNNQTTFYAISTSDKDIFIQKKTKAIMLLSVHDRIGILRDILDTFASKSLNLSRIVSIPSGQKAGEYMFLIDTTISDKEDNLEEVIKGLKQYCTQIRVLGKV